MYHYFVDKKFLDRARPFAVSLAERVQNLVREKGMSCQFFGVGSNPRNMVTQNEDGPIDFDFNLNILSCEDWDNAGSIKETVRKCFNKAMREQGLSDVQDSTSSLTTELIHFKDDPYTEFSVDIAIVTKDSDGCWYRLIHQKTGHVSKDAYIWNKVRDSEGLEKRESWLKKNGHWQEVRDRYTKIKNRYLTRNDYNHPSFVCYIEAVNEIFQKRHK